MNLEVKPLSTTDYDEYLVGWWSDWEWAAPPKPLLPENGTGGYMVYDDGAPICAGFIYETNSGISWVDWIISDKNYRGKPGRKEGIKLLINTLTDKCKEDGALVSYALIKHKGLIDTYKEIGYVEGDTYSSEMIKTL